MRAKPHQMRIQPGHLVEHDPQILCPLGNLELQQFFNCQTVAEVVAHGGQVIDPIGHRDHLLIKLCLAGFLDAGMQIADIRNDL